jgi:hypothetical protein
MFCSVVQDKIKYEKVYLTFNIYCCQSYIFLKIINFFLFWFILSVEINNIIITLVIRQNKLNTK